MADSRKSWIGKLVDVVRDISKRSQETQNVVRLGATAIFLGDMWFADNLGKTFKPGEIGEEFFIRALVIIFVLSFVLVPLSYVITQWFIGRYRDLNQQQPEDETDD